MRNDFLDVVGSYYNFRRFKAPQRLFNNWVTYHLDSGVRLTIVDCAFGERPHELQIDDTRLKHVRLLHVRAQAHSELWIRDALINWGVAHLPDDSKYVCWDDTDVKHVRPDWAAETVHMLQHCRVGQTWSTSIDLGPDGQIVPNDWGEETDRSFCQAWLDGDVHLQNQPHCGSSGHPALSKVTAQAKALRRKRDKQTDWRAHTGYSWAMRRETFEQIGGLIPWMVTGSADWHMAYAFAGYLGEIDPRMSPGYIRRLQEFCCLCDRYIEQDIGCVPGTLMHPWHGRKKDRNYCTRFDIVLESGFDPDNDLAFDSKGLPMIASGNRVLRDGLRRLAMKQNADSVDVEPSK